MEKRMNEIMDAVFKELVAMPRDKFIEALDREGDGDIASILLYTGALKVRETEAEEFSPSTTEIRVVAPPDYKANVYMESVLHPILCSYVPANDTYYPEEGIQVSLTNRKKNEVYSTDTDEELPWAA